MHARSTEPRIRLGIGSYSAIGDVGAITVGILGISFQLGLQLTDDFAVYGVIQGSTALLLNIASGALLFERQLFGRLSLATGVGAVTVSDTLQSFQFSSSGFPPSTHLDSTSVTLPVRIAINLGSVDPKRSLQQRFYIAIDGAVGVQVSGSQFANGFVAGHYSDYVGLSLGYVAM